MAEDNIYRRMSPHDAARIKRLTQDRGHFTNCRHYRKLKDRQFECSKRGRIRDCTGCFTCPNCNGLMFTDKLQRDRRSDRIYITHTKSCAICGAYIEQQYVTFIPRSRQEHVEDKTKCEVHDCKNTAYEGYKHYVDGHEFRICITHHNRIRSWKQHPTKGDEQKPMIMENGRLVDNPNYTIKQRTRQ